MNQQSLLDNIFQDSNSEKDNTQIVQVLLYYSEEEAKEFKRICKEGIKREFPKEYFEKGNVSDFIIKILRKYHEQNKS